MAATLGLVVAQGVLTNAGIALMARLRGLNYVLVSQAALQSIAYTVLDQTTGAQLASGTFTISSVVFNQLQQSDGLWLKDSAQAPGKDGAWGYNLKAILPAAATALANSGDRLQVDLTLVPVTGEQSRVRFFFSAL